LRGPFQVDFETRSFPRATPFPGHTPLYVAWPELVLAAITVGRWPPHVFEHGHYSRAEVLHRAHCLRAYYDTVDGRLRSTPAAAALDPSERGIAGYYLGMALAKVVATRHFRTPYLMHVSRYGTRWSLEYVGPRRPDLFGPTAGGWLVAEAKGRQRIRTQLIDDMVEQKSAVATINGAAPRYRIGVATRTRRGDYELLIVDPDADERADHLVIDREDWIAAYYRPVRGLVEDFPAEASDGVRWERCPTSTSKLGSPSPSSTRLRSTTTGTLGACPRNGESAPATAVAVNAEGRAGQPIGSGRGDKVAIRGSRRVWMVDASRPALRVPRRCARSYAGAGASSMPAVKILRRLWTRACSRCSPAAASRPRRRTWPAFWRVCICPNTGSTIALRLA
jgi:hypothetical protein